MSQCCVLVSWDCVFDVWLGREGRQSVRVCVCVARSVAGGSVCACVGHSVQFAFCWALAPHQASFHISNDVATIQPGGLPASHLSPW